MKKDVINYMFGELRKCVDDMLDFAPNSPGAQSLDIRFQLLSQALFNVIKSCE